jgi:hypothetical protein
MMSGMETPRARHKLGEAGFFLSHLRKEREGDSNAFGYFLSAFLNASYSLVKLLEVEAKRELKKDAQNKKKAKAAFGPWYENWANALSPEEHEVWVLMEAQRRDEVHLLGAETVKETKAIPLEPPRGNPAVFYTTFLGSPPLLVDDAWRAELRRLGLPPWVSAWREAQVHHFEVAGERRDVVETCLRYLALLERLLNDLHKSPLAATAENSTADSAG